MGIPDFQTLMLPILQRLADRRWRTAELIEAVADQYHLSEEERKTLLPSGRQSVIANRTHWAIAYLNKGGLITRVSRGEYEASDRGRDVLKSAPQKITIGFLKQFPDFVMIQGAGSEGDKLADTSSVAPSFGETQNATPEERIEFADRDLKRELAASLLVRVRTIAPSAFEQLIVDLLLKMGYGGSRQDAARGLRIGRPGDGGVDGVIREDALGLDAIYVQAKRYAEDNTIGAPVIQGFAGALLSNGATKGVFVTTSRFTQQARDVAAGFKTHRLVLIDGEELARLMIEHGIGVHTVQIIRVQRVDLEKYEEQDAAS